MDVLVLQPLGVIGGKARENQHAEGGNREFQRGGLKEDVHDGRNDQADHAHDQERAPARQVLLGRVAVETERQEGDRGDEERLSDGGAGVDREDERDGDAHHRRERPENDLRHRRAHLVDGRRKQENKAEWREHQHPAEPREEHGFYQRRRDNRSCWLHILSSCLGLFDRIDDDCEVAADDIGHNACDRHCDAHKAVNLAHIRAKALVDIDANRRFAPYCGAIVSHESSHPLFIPANRGRRTANPFE